MIRGGSVKSRMERYYEVDSDTSKRTKKNADLYQRIYENEEYNNIEGFATTLKPNEIDISKIKEMLQNRDQRNKTERDFRDFSSKPKVELENIDSSFEHDHEKNYDIRDILDKAKSERKDTDTSSYHKLNQDSYDYLKDRNEKEKSKNEEDEELRDLIHTITNTSMLNKLGDQELSLGILDELKSNTMVGDASSIRPILEEEKETKKENSDIEDDKQNMDKSFFTSSLNFKEDDFDEIQEMGKNLKKNDFWMNILIFILLVVFTTSIIFYILK